MIRSKLVLGVLFGALLALSAGSAAGAQDDPYAPTTAGPTTTAVDDIDTVTVVIGGSVDVSGDGCAPGAAVTITWDDGTVLGTVTADDNGDFVATITVPADASIGVHLVTGTCGDVEQFINVNVVAKAAPVNTGTLARTGSSNNTGVLVGLGAAAVVLGGAFVYGARKPRQA